MADTEVKDDAPSQLPWVEKYRPSSLDQLVGHEHIVSTIHKLMDAGHLPHMLLYGPPGTGKTSTIHACAEHLYPDPKKRNAMTLELNASDARGIDVVRENIKQFAETSNIFSSGRESTGNVKLIILDEADAMTNDAQFALRRVIEQHSRHVRFCLICNDVNKIIPALQSRCTRFRFAPLERKLIRERLEFIVQSEGLTATDDGLDAVTRIADGDLRKMLNILQATAMSFSEINGTNVHICTGQPRPEHIEAIMDHLLNRSFGEAHAYIIKMQVEQGLAMADIVTQVGKYVMMIQFPPSVRIFLLIRLADIELRLSVGASEKLQVGALVGCFAEARDMMTKK